MESIVRNVKDIESDERQHLETALGLRLHDNQTIIVRVVNLGVEPDQQVRAKAFGEAQEIARQGRAHAASSGISEDEAGAVIDEAIEDVRKRRSHQ